ncbi:MAG: hypothetical protein WD004_04165 [Actinomycetota bacterium]
MAETGAGRGSMRTLGSVGLAAASLFYLYFGVAPAAAALVWIIRRARGR